MSSLNNIAPNHDEAQPTTAVFVTDDKAATVLLHLTVSSLLASRRIERGLVDLTNRAGLTVAAAFEQAGIAYEHLDFGQPAVTQLPEQHTFVTHEPRTMADYEHLMRMSAGTRTERLEDVLTNADVVVIIPAANNAEIDPSEHSGRALAHCEQLGREILLVAPPEMGIRHVPLGEKIIDDIENYERIVITVRDDIDT